MKPCVQTSRQMSSLGEARQLYTLLRLLMMERFLPSSNCEVKLKSLPLPVIDDACDIVPAPCSACELWLSAMMQACVLWTANSLVIMGISLLSQKGVCEVQNPCSFQ